jgi:hypothetical protein
MNLNINNNSFEKIAPIFAKTNKQHPKLIYMNANKIKKRKHKKEIKKRNKKKAKCTMHL